MIDLTLLASDAKLAKTITRTGAGWTVKGFQAGWSFTLGSITVRDIFEFSTLLTALEDAPSTCIIRGQAKAGIEDGAVVNRRIHDRDEDMACFEPRPEGNRWMMIDIDEWPSTCGPDATEADHLQSIIDRLPAPFDDVTFHFQWSSNAGINGWDTLYCHLFFVLNTGWRDDILCDLVRQQDWPFDVSPLRTVQPNYTAKPIFVGGNDPIERRSGLVTKSKNEVWLPGLVRKVTPPAPRYLPTSNATAAFEGHLEAIGKPRFHDTINAAIAAYVKAKGQHADADYIIGRVKEAVASAGGSGRHHGIYLNDNYLRASFNGAQRITMN